MGSFKAMKSKDFVLDKGTIKNTIRRGVDINGKKSNLKVEYTLNHKKGLIAINIRLDNDQIMSNDDVQNEATIQAMVGLALAAIEKATKWRDDWQSANAETDDNQLKIEVD